MLTSCPSLTELRLQCLLASCLALTGRQLRDISVSAVRNWLLDRKRGGERIRVRAAMNGASVPALGSDPHIFLQASSHVCHMLQMSPIAAQREIVPRDEGRGPKGGRGEGQRQKARSRGPWKGRECHKMQGKEGTLGWWWWGCRELTSTPRKREKKWMMPGCEHAHGRLAPHQNRDSGIASLRMMFNPGKVRRGFLGASIEGAHWTGGVAKSRKFPGSLGSVSHRWKRTVWRAPCAQRHPLPSRPKDETTSNKR